MSNRRLAAASLFVLIASAASAARAESSDDWAGRFRTQVERVRAQNRALNARMRADARDRDRMPPSLDLSGELPPAAASAMQFDIGSCHDFAATAALEAAYFRYYGVHVSLSKADLFLQETILRAEPGVAAQAAHDAGAPEGAEHFYADFIRRGSESGEEGDDPAFDVMFALRHGVASARSVPYSDLLKDYARSERQAVAGDMAAANRDAASLDRRNGTDRSAPLPVNGARTIEAARREEAVQLTVADKQIDRVKALYARLDADQIARERNGFRDAARTFRPVVWTEKSPAQLTADPLSVTPAACRAERERFLFEQLRAGSPVVITLNIAGLKGWGYDKSASPAAHAVLVDGYRFDGGRLVFTILNSWGPAWRTPLPEDQLCRVAAMVAVRTPRDP